MTPEEIKAQAPDGATHYWVNEYGWAYYFYSNQIRRWMFYDKYHDYWFSIKDPYFENTFKPL